MSKETKANPTPAQNIQVRTWFIEPVFSHNLKVATGLVRVWGRARQGNRGIRWWRSSSIYQRMSATTLQTRFGTIIKLQGAICKKYAKKLRMNTDAIERFRKGFPATWKKLLVDAFNAEVLKEPEPPVTPRRSPRRHSSFDSKAEPHNVQQKPKRPALRPTRQLSLPEAPVTPRRSPRRHSSFNSTAKLHNVQQKPKRPALRTTRQLSLPEAPVTPRRSPRRHSSFNSTAEPHDSQQKPKRPALRTTRKPSLPETPMMPRRSPRRHSSFNSTAEPHNVQQKQKRPALRTIRKPSLPEAPVTPRRSPRRHSTAEPHNAQQKQKQKQPASRTPRQLSISEPSTSTGDKKHNLRQGVRNGPPSDTREKTKESSLDASSQRRKLRSSDKPYQVVTAAKPPRPKTSPGTPITRSRTKTRKSKQAAITQNRSLAQKDEDSEEEHEEDEDAKPRPQAKTRKRRRSGGLARPEPVVQNEKHSLAQRLKSVQDAKRARRARRVAFATEENDPKPRTSDEKEQKGEETDEKGTGWTEEQRAAFERQRNSVSADIANYWEAIADGVEGKSADECRTLWEASWASPRTKPRAVLATPAKKLKQLPTGQMVADLQKASRRARSRNTGKFRQQTRELVERVAEGTQDELLEPAIPGAEATESMIVTPKMGTTGVLGYGTPGTEVRALREKNNQAGNLVTPEILARGKGFGLAEADQYVALFKRRVGAGKRGDEGGEERNESKGEEEEGEEDVGRVRRRIGGDDDSEYSDESGGSSPFF